VAKTCNFGVVLSLKDGDAIAKTCNRITIFQRQIHTKRLAIASPSFKDKNTPNGEDFALSGCLI
jgi:hypothetical protein